MTLSDFSNNPRKVVNIGRKQIHVLQAEDKKQGSQINVSVSGMFDGFEFNQFVTLSQLILSLTFGLSIEIIVTFVSYDN